MRYHHDATVHFRMEPEKPISERVCAWTVASLWFLSGAVILAAAFS